MRTHKELIDIAKSMNCDAKYAGYYDFARNFLMNPSIEDKQDKFFKIIKLVQDTVKKKSTQAMLGIRNGNNNNSESDIKMWCRIILTMPVLKQVSEEELHYIMAYCSRLSAISRLTAISKNSNL